MNVRLIALTFPSVKVVFHIHNAFLPIIAQLVNDLLVGLLENLVPVQTFRNIRLYGLLYAYSYFHFLAVVAVDVLLLSIRLEVLLADVFLVPLKIVTAQQTTDQLVF